MVLGLTGSIGMGKSATAQMFRDEGVPVHDSDAEVHALYKGGAAVAPLEVAFPGVSVGGMIDRERLRTHVIVDPTALQRIEAIVHPLVRAARVHFLEAARTRGEAVVVLDVPLLFEVGAEREVDRVVVVSAPESVQKARVMARPNMTEAVFSAIKAKQMPDAEKRRRADVVVETGSGFKAARAQVRAIVADARAMAD